MTNHTSHVRRPGGDSLYRGLGGGGASPAHALRRDSQPPGNADTAAARPRGCCFRGPEQTSAPATRHHILEGPSCLLGRPGWSPWGCGHHALSPQTSRSLGQETWGNGRGWGTSCPETETTGQWWLPSQGGSPPNTTALLVGKLRLRTFPPPVTREPQPGQPQDPGVPSYLAARGSACGHSLAPSSPYSLGTLPRQAGSAPAGPEGLCLPQTPLPASPAAARTTVPAGLRRAPARPGAKAVLATSQRGPSSWVTCRGRLPVLPEAGRPLCRYRPPTQGPDPGGCAQLGFRKAASTDGQEQVPRLPTSQGPVSSAVTVSPTSLCPRQRRESCRQATLAPLSTN